RSVSYLYHRSPERTERIGEGGAMGLSPDERWVLLLDNENRRKLRLMPVGGGTVVPVRETGLAYQWARFLPDGNEAIVLAEDGTGVLGLFRISLREKAEPFQIARAMMVRNLAVSPRGDEVAVLAPSGKTMMYSTRSHEPGSGLKI